MLKSSYTLKSILTAVSVCLILCVFTTNEAKSQDFVDAQSSVFLELGGNSLIYSLNYDYRFNSDWSARGGLMVMPAGDVTFTIIPIMGNYLLGTTHMLELGLGVAYVGVSLKFEDAEGFGGFNASTLAGTSTIGYRYQPPAGGFMFRAGLAPLFSQFGVLPMPGISFGYGF